MTSTDRITATYRIESPLPIAAAAEAIAGEQSCGTFVDVPGETAELRRRFRARVEAIRPLEDAEGPSLAGALAPDAARGARHYRAEIDVSWPFANVGANLPALVAAIQGNLYELREVSGLKLLERPHAPGPRDAHIGGHRLSDGAAPHTRIAVRRTHFEVLLAPVASAR